MTLQSMAKIHKDDVSGIDSEDDVKKLVLKYLSELGLSLEDISVEYKTVTLHAFGNAKITVDKKSRSHASGRIDLLIRNDTKKYLFVVEMKKPNVNIDSAKSQALSYARLLLAPFVIITNLNDTKIIDSITGEELHQTNESQYVKNGFRYDISDDLRNEALQNFIGYSYENLLAFCEFQRDIGMEEISSSKSNETNKKYLPDLYINRNNIELTLDQFLGSDNPLLLIHGKSGVGKSNVMCHLARKCGAQYPTIFLNGSLLSNTIEAEITQYFNFNFSAQKTYPSIIKKMEKLSEEMNMPFVIFIDAIDECNIPNFPTVINTFLKHLAKRNFKVVLSTKTYEISRRFLYINDLPTQIESSLMVECSDFSDGEFANALNKYASFFKISGQIPNSVLDLCRSPFMMRITFETYSQSNEGIPQDVTAKEIIEKFLEKKLQKTNPEQRDKCRFLLDQIIKIMDRNHASYVAINDVYGETDISLTPVMEFLRSHYILLESKDKVTFYHEQLRDYLYAVKLKQWDSLSNQQFYDDVQEALSEELGQHALFWYRDNTSNDKKKIIEGLFQTKAYNFLHVYNTIIETHFRPIRKLFQPYTDSNASLFLITLGEEKQNIIAFALIPREEDQNLITWKSCKPHEILDIEAHYFKEKGAKRFYYRYDFSDAHRLAELVISRDLQQIIKFKKLIENTNPILIQERLFLLIYKYHRELGLGDMTQNFWRNIFPLSLDTFLDYNVKYMKFWIFHLLETLKSRTHGDPEIIDRYYELSTLDSLFNQEPTYLTLVEHKVKSVMASHLDLFEFPWNNPDNPDSQITSEVRSIIGSLIQLRNQKDQIVDPLVSFVDMETGQIINSQRLDMLLQGYSDHQLESHIEKFFKSFIEAYRILIKDNFSNLSLVSESSILLNHPHIVIQYDRRSVPVKFTYFVFTSESEVVEIHQRTDHHNIIEDRGGAFYIRTNKGEKKVNGYTSRMINEIFGVTPIRNWCYAELDSMIGNLVFRT